MSRAFCSFLYANGQKKLCSELVRLWSEHVHSGGNNTTRVDAENPEVIVLTRRGERRAESLAERIEEGAAGLVAFVEGLQKEEWRKPVSQVYRRSCRRPVLGAPHVAIVDPIEIYLERAIAGGKMLSRR